MSKTTLRTWFEPYTAAEWTSNNPVLLRGELGQESDTGRCKLGNGTDVWTDLPYLDSMGSGVEVRINSGGSTYTRPRINIIAGTGVSLSLSDDGGNGEVDLTITASGTDGRILSTVLAGDVTDNSGALTDLTGFYLELEEDKVYAVHALVRFETNNTNCGAAFALRGPIGGTAPRSQVIHTMVPTTVNTIVDRESNDVHETGTISPTSNTLTPANTVFLAQLFAIVVTTSSGGSGQYFLAYHGDGSDIITIKAGTCMYAIEQGTL